MRFTNDELPIKKSSSHKSELTDTVAEEHPKHFVAVAEEQIKAMHHHEDGSSVELHEVGSREFIAQSIGSSLEGKITGGSGFNENEKFFWQQNNQNTSNPNTAKIEYEKKSSQQPQQLYGIQQSVTGGAIHKQETAMVGCNCGAEWTVTGQSTKANNPNNPAATVKIEQYSSAAEKGAGYKVSSGGGSGQGEYRAGGGAQQQEYKG